MVMMLEWYMDDLGCLPNTYMLLENDSILIIHSERTTIINQIVLVGGTVF